MKIEFEIPSQLKSILTLLSRATDNDINQYAKEEFLSSLRTLIEQWEAHTEAFKPELRILYDFEQARQEQRKAMRKTVSA